MQLERVESGIAADIQHRCSRHVCGERRLDYCPKFVEEVAQRVVRRGANSAKIEIMEPRFQLPDLRL